MRSNFFNVSEADGQLEGNSQAVRSEELGQAEEMSRFTRSVDSSKCHTYFLENLEKDSSQPSNSGTGVLNTTLSVASKNPEASTEDTKHKYYKLSLVSETSKLLKHDEDNKQNGSGQGLVQKEEHLSAIENPHNLPSHRNYRTTSTEVDKTTSHVEPKDKSPYLSDLNSTLKNTSPIKANMKETKAIHAEVSEASQGDALKDQRQLIRENKEAEDNFLPFIQELKKPSLNNTAESAASSNIILNAESVNDQMMDDADSAADLDVFVDTLRSIESPAILKRPRGTKQIKSPLLAMFSSLPSIEEDLPLQDESSQLPASTTKSEDVTAVVAHEEGKLPKPEGKEKLSASKDISLVKEPCATKSEDVTNMATNEDGKFTKPGEKESSLTSKTDLVKEPHTTKTEDVTNMTTNGEGKEKSLALKETRLLKEPHTTKTEDVMNMTTNEEGKDKSLTSKETSLLKEPCTTKSEDATDMATNKEGKLPKPEDKERSLISKEISLKKEVNTKGMLTPGQIMKLQQAEAKPKILLSRASAEQSIVFKQPTLYPMVNKPSLLLSERLENTTPTADDKLYSRLDRSFLFSNYNPSEDFSVYKGQTRFLQLDLRGPTENTSPLLNGAGVNPLLTSPTVYLLNNNFSRTNFFNPLEHWEATNNEMRAKTPAVLGGLEKGSEVHRRGSFLDLQKTRKKEHGKINARPGKIILYDEPNCKGNKTEIWGNVVDTSSWDLPPAVSISVVRGGWIMYEKPQFQGKKCALEEGNFELANLWKEEEDNPDKELKPVKFGSVRRVVRDYGVPKIDLFPEEKAEGKSVTFQDASDDTRMYGKPIKTQSIIISSGLWLIYSKPFFEGVPSILLPGGYPNLEAWETKEPYVGSLLPITMGAPVVEEPQEPMIEIFEKAYFTGKSCTFCSDARTFITRKDAKTLSLRTAGSIKVLGGCWVGYEKEGFHGHQYLLEEGMYQDWTEWGGYNDGLKSLHLIRADFTDPRMILFDDTDCGESVEVTETVPDIELTGYGTTTKSIHVLSGVWVAYENVDYSGAQYILEKGFYRNCEDWGASDYKISSVQPVLLVREEKLHSQAKIKLYTESKFSGSSVSYEDNQGAIPESFKSLSCRILGGSWVLYEGEEYTGNSYVLQGGEYSTLTAMGCPPNTSIRSVKKVPLVFSEPLISLYNLECFEGKEIELTTEMQSILANGFNNHTLSVHVKGGMWVVYEHSNYRGQQWLLETIEISNWPKYSGVQHVGSLCPIRQKRIYFKLKNGELNQYLSVMGDIGELKTGRVVLSDKAEGIQNIWYYEAGFIKNKVSAFLPELWIVFHLFRS
nr:PREDICTED: absent in melanoma 1-like protein [Latimeria chalumnae]|eukprot:XP_014342661.1 PREDICTED: absent in melanoma 1-like protein [Latimeria chalumnae]